MGDPVNANPIEELGLFGKKKQFNNPYSTWRSYNIRELPCWKIGWLPECEKDYNKMVEAGIKEHNIEELVNRRNYEVDKETCECDMEALRKRPNHGSVQATWLGHASVLVQFSNGLNCLV